MAGGGIGRHALVVKHEEQSLAPQHLRLCPAPADCPAPRWPEGRRRGTRIWQRPGRCHIRGLARSQRNPPEQPTGLGKSAVTLDLALRVSAGLELPDGERCGPAGVVLLSAEEGLADTIRPRLDAAGADTAIFDIYHKVPMDLAGPSPRSRHAPERGPQITGASHGGTRRARRLRTGEAEGRRAADGEAGANAHGPEREQPAARRTIIRLRVSHYTRFAKLGARSAPLACCSSRLNVQFSVKLVRVTSRVSDYESEGRRFESCRARPKNSRKRREPASPRFGRRGLLAAVA